MIAETHAIGKGTFEFVNTFSPLVGNFFLQGSYEASQGKNSIPGLQGTGDIVDCVCGRGAAVPLSVEGHRLNR